MPNNSSITVNQIRTKIALIKKEGLQANNNLNHYEFYRQLLYKVSLFKHNDLIERDFILITPSIDKSSVLILKTQAKVELSILNAMEINHTITYFDGSSKTISFTKY